MNKHSMQLRCQLLANNVCEKTKLPHIKVKVSFENHNTKRGEYFWEEHWIKVYQTVRNHPVQWERMKETVLHELAHYFQYYYFNSLTHNEEFKNILDRFRNYF